MLSHREISSRSERLSVCLERRRSGGRIPPVGEITEKTEEDSRSNRRPIALIGSPACQRSQISDHSGIGCEMNNHFWHATLVVFTVMPPISTIGHARAHD